MLLQTKEENKYDDLKRLKVVTYNIFVDGYNNKMTLKAIANLDADILILQEANKYWMKSILSQDSIINKYKNIDFTFSYNSYEGGSIILCKNKNHKIKCRNHIKTINKGWYRMHSYLINLSDLDLNQNINIKNKISILENENNKNNQRCDDWRDKGQNEKEFYNLITENDLLIYSIHLVAPWPLQGDNCFDNCCSLCLCHKYNKNKIRLQEIIHNFDYYYNKKNNNINNIPTIICGDFNCKNGKCHEYLSNVLLFKKTFKVKTNYCCCCKHEPHSWRGLFCQMCCFSKKCFDHIYYKNLLLNESKVLYGIGDSDHWPVSATFTILD